jgi:fatty-acyl-CoA synthase
MVIRGGENIYPREIEEFLVPPPAGAGRAGGGRARPQKYGEELCAWIIAKPGTKPTEDDIRAFCKGQIAHYKVPRYIRFVTSFPDDGDRQDPEVQDPRRDEGPAGPGRTKTA